MNKLTYKLGLYNQTALFVAPGCNMADAYGIAIQAYENGEPYAVLTVNLPSRLGNFCEMIGLKNAAYADTNNCPWIKELVEAGVVKDTGFTKQSGFCEYPLYLFDENWLKSLEPIDPNFTYDVYSRKFDELMSDD